MTNRKLIWASFYAILLSIIPLTGVPFSWAAESVILPADDVYGMQQNANTVKNETELKVTSHSGEKNKRSLLKFDLSTIPTECIIDSATLELYLLTPPGSSRVQQLYFVPNDSWTETTLTWNNQPGFTDLLATANTGTTANTSIVWGGSLGGKVGGEYAGDGKISLLIKDSLEDNSPGAKEASYASKEHAVSPKPSLRVSYTCGEQQGCGHGFWKNHIDLWPSTYFPDDLLKDHFSGIPFTLENDTLDMALSYGGGPSFEEAAQILLRNAVASLLNAADLGVDFPMTEADVITAVNSALSSGNRGTVLTLEGELDTLNNLGCPLGK
jgi:hypothetical protein